MDASLKAKSTLDRKGMSRIEQALDIIHKLNLTKQTYIIGHDIPVSLSRFVYASLEQKRREMAEELGVPENQFEFEDCVGVLTGMMSIEDWKKARDSPATMDKNRE